MLIIEIVWSHTVKFLHLRQLVCQRIVTAISYFNQSNVFLDFFSFLFLWQIILTSVSDLYVSF